MKKWQIQQLLLIVSLVLLLLAGCNRANPGDQPGEQPGNQPGEQENLTAADFFPLDKDVHKQYKGTGHEFAEYETYVDYVRNNHIQIRLINPGTTMVSVYEVTDGAVRKVFSQGETYYRYDYTAARNADEIVIKAPIAVGTTWTLADGSERSITAVDKEITTPAGSYKALEITTKGPQSTVVDYYVQGIGHVKQVFKSAEDESFTVASELQKLERDVPYKQTIRFYFPDFPNERLVYLDRAVESRTNEDMKWKFQKEMKTVPEGSKLTKLLGPNVQVNSITVDHGKGSVTADFSKELLQEMNAGAGLEGMILDSIVNTLGGYYQCDKVVLTIEGKPYASGHYEMKPGEYFTPDLDKAVKYER